jgi:methylenetetrahydrofolate--tRNA-(uracil-5-)-methyltransferase
MIPRRGRTVKRRIARRRPVAPGAGTRHAAAGAGPVGGASGIIRTVASDTVHHTTGRHHVRVIGGGLAGSEAAWQLAERGVDVTLYEMRPHRQTPAHQTDRLAELVCSNSLGSDLPDRASGLLKAELRSMGSMVVGAADVTAVAAGGALAVDRDAFAARITDAIAAHPRIDLVREEVTELPDGPTVVATGPLTSPAFSDALARLTGADHLYFFDALAPIVTAESIDLSIAFRQSRYGRGVTEEGDYINCPLSREEFDAFASALLAAERIPLRAFETADERLFEGCLPVEAIAARGQRALLFGPMRPVGLRDPRTGRRPHAVVQLRRDDAAGDLYNLVGFQTNLRWPEQRRVLRMIPGLGAAEFVRLGQMHRNTFLNAPALLDATLALRGRDDLFFAGQITGIEGYTGNIGSGLVAGTNAARYLLGGVPVVPPPSTMIGALCRYVTRADARTYQPMKANFGLLPPLVPAVRGKRERYQAYAERALVDLDAFLAREAWGVSGGPAAGAACDNAALTVVALP